MTSLSNSTIFASRHLEKCLKRERERENRGQQAASKILRGAWLDFFRARVFFRDSWIFFRALLAIGSCQELVRLNPAFDSVATSDKGCQPRSLKNSLNLCASNSGCQQPVFAEALCWFFDLSRSSGCIIFMQIRLRVSEVRQPKTQAPQISRPLIM